MKKLKLSQLETRLVGILAKHDEIYVAQLAKLLFKGVRKDLRPANPNNSVISAIRQINRKHKGMIKGVNRGRNGKLVRLSALAID